MLRDNRFLMEGPDRTFYNIKVKIKKEWKIAFLSAFIAGMLTHFYMFSNNLLTWDSMFSLYAPQEMSELARPFLVYVCGVSTNFNLPAVLGTLSILYLSLTASAVVECFGIKCKSLILLASVMLVTFPAVSGTFCYLYTADGYMLALLLSVLCVLCAERGKAGVLAGGVLLAFSAGIYQAYVAFTATICVLKLMLILTESDFSPKFKVMTARYAGMGAGGGLLYIIVVRIFQSVLGTGLLSYNGIDKINQISDWNLISGTAQAYRTFYHFGLRSNVLKANPFMAVAFWILAAAGILLYSRALLRNGEKLGVRIILVLLLLALLPAATALFCLISPDVFVHIVMRMPWYLLFVFVFVLARNSEGSVQWGVLACGAVMAFNFYLVSNIVYFNMNEKYEKSYALCVRLAGRIEQTEGYYPNIRTAFIGGAPDYRKYPSTSVADEVLDGYYPAKSDYFLNSTDKYVEFMSHYLNVSLAAVSGEEEKELQKKEEIIYMDTFPAADSVRIIDGVLVIKMGERN